MEGHTSGTIEASVRYRLSLREMVCDRLLSGAISFEIMVLGATALTPWMTCAGILISVQFFKYFILFMKVSNKRDGKKLKQHRDACGTFYEDFYPWTSSCYKVIIYHIECSSFQPRSIAK